MEELENLRAGWRKLCSCGFTASELAEHWRKLCSCGFTASELAEHWRKLCSCGFTASELAERWRARTGRYERIRATLSKENKA